MKIVTTFCLTFALVLPAAMVAAQSASYLSHAPTRPLPRTSQRPLERGASLKFVSPRGDDAAAGSEAAPWQTLAHAVRQLKAGDTLVLRGGTYYEHVTATLRGTADKPITLRTYPGEMAILDGGLREFFDAPNKAWEPCPGGVEGEFWSTKTYPNLAGADGPGLLGNFGDSMTPLQGYRLRGDLQSDNPFWNVTNKVGQEDFVYCGPGIWYDAATGRIHARLAHTKLAGLHEDNYRGATDPRQVSLIIAGEYDGSVLTLERSQHVRLQDLVLRGSRAPTLQFKTCRNIELDGLTVYGGSTAIALDETLGLRMQHTACRGIGAPWTFRGMLKYRSLEARLLSASRWESGGAEMGQFEIAHCEFTDSVDGVFIGNVRSVRFHHNLLENITDDGIFLTAATGYDGYTAGGDVQIYQNRFSRILTTFAFGVGHSRQRVTETGKQTGSGVHIFRNVFDMRRPVWYQWPNGPDAPQEITSRGRFAGDHGGPAWEPMWIYHNTIIAGGTPRYDYGSDGLIHGTGHGTRRRVFNNIVCLTEGTPGTTLPDVKVDFQGDGNLLWSLHSDKPLDDSLFAKFRKSPAYEASKAKYPAGWTTHDEISDPQLTRLSADWRETTDLRPTPGSPAIDAGVSLDSQWPDTLRQRDAGRPDRGALPAGMPPWRIGIYGRLDVCNATVSAEPLPSIASWHYPPAAPLPANQRRAVIVEGYPAFDSPLIAYLLRRAGWQVDISERKLLDPHDIEDYSLLVFDGSLTRAKAGKTQLERHDLSHLQSFLENGGTVLLMRERPAELFSSPNGRKFWEGLVGTGSREPKPEMRVQIPGHPWTKHLAGQDLPDLIAKASPIRTGRGEVIVGSQSGAAALYRLPVEKGQLIYVGWTIANSIPHGREKTTVEQEAAFDDQIAILKTLLEHCKDK